MKPSLINKGSKQYLSLSSSNDLITYLNLFSIGKRYIVKVEMVYQGTRKSTVWEIYFSILKIFFTWNITFSLLKKREGKKNLILEFEHWVIWKMLYYEKQISCHVIAYLRLYKLYCSTRLTNKMSGPLTEFVRTFQCFPN